MRTPGSKTGSAHRAMPLVAEQEPMATRETDALWNARTSLEAPLLGTANAVQGGTQMSALLLESTWVATSAKCIKCVSA
jgi:hypothetical protein